MESDKTVYIFNEKESDEEIITEVAKVSEDTMKEKRKDKDRKLTIIILIFIATIIVLLAMITASIVKSNSKDSEINEMMMSTNEQIEQIEEQTKEELEHITDELINDLAVAIDDTVLSTDDSDYGSTITTETLYGHFISENMHFDGYEWDTDYNNNNIENLSGEFYACDYRAIYSNTIYKSSYALDDGVWTDDAIFGRMLSVMLNGGKPDAHNLIDTNAYEVLREEIAGKLGLICFINPSEDRINGKVKYYYYYVRDGFVHLFYLKKNSDDTIELTEVESLIKISQDGIKYIMESGKDKRIYVPASYMSDGSFELSGYASDLEHTLDNIKKFTVRGQMHDGIAQYDELEVILIDNTVQKGDVINLENSITEFKIGSKTYKGLIHSCEQIGLFIELDGDVYAYQKDKGEFYRDFIGKNVDLNINQISDLKIAELMQKREEIVSYITNIYDNSDDGIMYDQQSGVVAISSDFLFDVDSTEFEFDLTEYSSILSLVDVYCKLVKMYSTDIKEIRITGYTDSTGDEEYNQTLSEKRAAAMANEIISLGLGWYDTDLSQFVTSVGQGENHIIYNEDGSENKNASRRVDFTIILSGE